MGEKIFDRQPNWIIPPARSCNQHPVRYRTPTPYPKDDRKRVAEPASAAIVVVPEKAFVVEAPVVSHVEATGIRKHRIMKPWKPHAHNPQTPVTITWEMSPRLNRFERVA
ncbi:uncharacterized protein B0H64DRAFT_444277 [Chaetomium fimeti]|uniref:Uncharacterized protein n=1 Tax=Chaetomium fimeti TaxID=1854472 RepID=A0AAE0LPT7_9PEZI|nr:hypothetical protein B0H64DRAFT_444277 [Chaetomium fimeti]